VSEKPTFLFYGININEIMHWLLFLNQIQQLLAPYKPPGLNVATCGVVNATSFYSVATKFSRLVANLATKIGDFLLWENVH